LEEVKAWIKSAETESIMNFILIEGGYLLINILNVCYCGYCRSMNNVTGRNTFIGNK